MWGTLAESVFENMHYNATEVSAMQRDRCVCSLLLSQLTAYVIQTCHLPKRFPSSDIHD